MLGFQLGRGTHDAGCGVVHEEVQAAELVADCVNQGVDGVWLADVRTNLQATDSEGDDLLLGFASGGVILQVVESDVGATAGQFQRDGAPNPTRCAADEGDLAFEGKCSMTGGGHLR